MNNFPLFQHPFFLRSIMILAWIISGLLLPLFICKEFNNDWLFYFQLYPHMVLFPFFFFGGVLFTLYQAILLIRSKRNRLTNIIIILGISLLLSFIEITSDNLMLFELKSTAISTLNNLPQETIEQIQNIPNVIIDTSTIINGKQLTIKKSDIEQTINNFRQHRETLNPKEKQGYYELIKLSLSYDTWKDKTQNFSTSRLLYIVSFFIIVSASIGSYIILFFYSSRDVRHPSQYIDQLTMSFLFFTAWTPLRFYYNLITKNLLFGYNSAIGNLDVFAVLTYLICFGFLFWRIYQINRDWLTMVVVFLIVSLLLYIGRCQPEIINLTFGLESNIITWFICAFGFIGIIWGYFTYRNSNRRINS